MSRRVHFSVTALSEAAGGRIVPSLPVALAYVEACGGDPQTWGEKWRALIAEVAPESADTEPREAPYRGLATFESADAKWFFGRERLIADLRQRLIEVPFLAVFAPSGAGKSSLLRAGLLPALRSCVDSAPHTWRTLLLTPGEHPLRELEIQLAKLQVPPGLARGVSLGDTSAVQGSIRHLLADQPAESCFAMIVDQFEELFTLCRDWQERQAFIDVLLTATEEPGARLILGVRADFYAQCAAHPRLVTALRDRQVLIGPMDDDDLLRVITGPAERAGLRVEPALVGIAVGDARGEPGALPLLSHALLEKWRRREGSMLTLAGYLASGGVRGAIAQTAERVYGDFRDDEQELVRNVFLRLTAFGEGTEDTRRRASPDELLSGRDAETVAEVLRRLTAERLITSDEDSVTIAHEALIQGWPRLRGWLAEDRELLRAHRRLTEAAAEWDGHRREDGFLFTGARLAVWEHRRLDRLNRLEWAFLSASRERATRERTLRRRRTRVGISALAATAALVSALAVVALVQADRARAEQSLALSRQLTAEARNQLQFDPEEALLLGQQAITAAPTVEAEMVLRQAVADHRLRAVMPVGAGRMLGVAVSPDGRRMVGTGADGTVRIWGLSGDRASSHSALILRGHQGEAWSPAFSPDGIRVATSGIDRTVRIWNVDGTGAPVILEGHTGAVWNVAFSPDGRRVASAGVDGTVRIWELTDARRSTVLRGHRGETVGVAFSPDGTMLASSGHDHTVRIWDLTGHRAPRILVGHTDATKMLAFSPDGTSLASVSIDGTARVWPVDVAGAPVVLRGHQGKLEAIAFSPDGRWLATASDDRTVRVWSRDGRGEPFVLRGHKDTVFAVAFTPDGSRLATASEDDTIRLWDPRVGGDPVFLRGHQGPVWAAAFSADGHQVFSGGQDRDLRVWDVRGNTEPRALRGHDDEILGITASPTGNLVASGSRDGTVRVWDPDSTNPPVVLRGHDGPAWVAALSPDGRRVASAGKDGTLRIWSTTGDGGPLVRRADADQIRYAAFSPDGTHVATGGWDGTVRIWDSYRNAAPLVLRGHDGLVWAVAFSPDGRSVASSGKDGTVRIWSAVDGSSQMVLPGHEGFAWFVNFSRDGKWLASAGQDGTVRIWRTDRSGPPITFDGFGASVETVVFSPDNQSLVTAHDDGTVRIWRCEACAPIDQILDLARQRGAFPQPLPR